MRIPFIVSLLLALAAVGAALGLAFYMNLITIPAGSVATASQTPRGSFEAPSFAATPSPSPSVAPTASPVPSASFAPGGTYTVKPGESLSLIADKVGVPWILIAQANNIQGPDYIVQVGQVLIIPISTEPTPGGDVYVVQLGDTITGIANKVGVDPTTLADFNNIVDWNTIQVGQIIYVPKDANATPLPTPSG